MSAATLSRSQIFACMEKVLSSETFANSARSQEFLRFIVTETLEGRSSSLKEIVIGTAVFSRVPGYDSKQDTVVRAAARRLRIKLEEYYEKEGKTDPVRIQLKAGTYIPSFLPIAQISEEEVTYSPREPEVPAHQPETQTAQQKRVIWPQGALVLALGAVVIAAIVLVAALPRQGGSWRSVPVTWGAGKQVFPALSPDGESVAFTWVRPGDTEAHIYVQSVAGKAQRQLTNSSASEERPEWCPDGRTLAFVSIGANGDKTIETVPLSGGQPRVVGSVNGGRMWMCDHPRLSWSPDGTMLTTVDRAGAYETCGVILIDLRYGTKRLLTTPSSETLADVEPSFSPDGRWIAFMRQATASSDSDLFVIPVEGGKERRITSDHAELRGFTWSADGNSLIAASNRDASFLNLWRFPINPGEPEKLSVGDVNLGFPTMSHDRNRIVYVAYRYDGNIWRLQSERNKAERSGPLIAAPGLDRYPQYSPDGRRIVFVSNRTGGVTNLWISDSEGRDPQALTEFTSTPAGSPAWAPDGRQIALDLQHNGGAEIYTVRPEPGSVPVRVTNEGGVNVLPAWSADGQYLYFGSLRGGTWNVFRVAANGGAATQITKNGGQRSAVSADGRWLYFWKLNDEIWRLPIDRQGPEELVVPGFWHIAGVDWAIGNGAMYFLAQGKKTAGDGVGIYRFDLKTRVAVEIGSTAKSANDIGVSPDGSSILYSQLDSDQTDILLLER